MEGYLAKKKKEQKEEHGRLLSKLQWGGPVGMNKSWRSIYKVRECKIQQRKGFAVSQTMSQPEQQASPSQWSGWCKTRQVQGRDLVDRAEPEMGDGLPSRDVPSAKNPSTGTAQQRLFLALKVVLHAVVVISKVLHLSTKSRCSRCCRHISTPISVTSYLGW